MNPRPLGATGLSVSAIGFGTWGLGGTAGGSVAYGPTDDSVSRAALDAALELGITFYDCSDLYGFGHSERIVGAAFAGRRECVVLGSKGGFVDAERQDFSPTHLHEALENSLARLGTDHVDLYQLHSPPVALLAEQPGILEFLREAQADGRIRAWGFSARSPEEAKIAVETFGVPCVQVNFNLTDQRALQQGLFEVCARSGCGVIIRTPLCFGFLTGQYEAGFDPMDHRSRWSPEQVACWRQANDAFRFLFEENPGQTPAQIALRFCLSFPSVSTVIPGMLEPGQVRENAAAMELGPLAPDQIERARKVGTETKFFVRRRA